MSYYGSDANLGTFENSFSEKAIRMAFIRKVYGILMVQLTITVGLICLFLYQPDVNLFSRKHPEFFYVVFAMSFITLIVLACCQNVRRSFPLNFICLFMFTILEGLLLGTAASLYRSEAVMMAIGICCVVCLGMTIFAFQTKYDFTSCYGFVIVSMLVFLCFGLIAIFIPGKIIQIVYASVGAFLFSMYLVFDTQMMMGGKHKYSISPEEYIFAALNIYLDIVNLFLMILQLIGLTQN